MAHMDKSEFRAQIETLPPGMRFVVRHVIPLCASVFVVFGALLVVVLARPRQAAFCHRRVLRRGDADGRSRILRFSGSPADA